VGGTLACILKTQNILLITHATTFFKTGCSPESVQNLCTTIPNKVIHHSSKQDFSLLHLGIMTLAVSRGKCMLLKVKDVANKKHCGKIDNLGHTAR
jgi:hypothetical protein